ncbi:MAG: S8 family peptidase [Chloroflexota bacterium]
MLRNRFVLALILCLTAFASTAAAKPALASQIDQRPLYVEGEILVRFKPGTAASEIDALNAKFQTQTIKHFTINDVYHLQLPAGQSVDAAIQAIEKEPAVLYAEPNGRYYLGLANIPNDPRFNEMYGLNNTGQTGGTPDADIDAPEAWDLTTGSHDVVVSVIDSGIELNHPDLAANLYNNPGEITNNGIDDDGNGFVDDIHGWDFVSNDPDPDPGSIFCLGHGTHTSGTVGAVGNNGTGVTGVNWDVQIMHLRAFKVVLLIFCSATDADLMEAIQYQTAMGVRISSNSWGSSVANQAMADAIANCGCIFVAAAGNGGLDGIGDNNDVIPNYPSNYPYANIIAVAATDEDDNRATFSNYGQVSVDVAAPGVGILSTWPANLGYYGSLDGTSMATPHVAGLAALVLAGNPSLTNDEIIGCILDGVDDVGLPIATGGRINAYNSLQLCGAGQNTMISASILMAWERFSPNELAARVRIGDPNGGVPVDGATVSADFTLPDGTASQTAATNSQGWASFLVDSAGGGSCTITVTNVTHPDYTFDPENSVLTRTINCP